MTKIIVVDLILDDDTVFDEGLEIYGSILSKNGNRYNLTVNGNIKARDITAKNITARNIIAVDINAGNIIANNIKARNIDAWDITAWDITAKNITARNITTRNLDTWDITAYDITAWNIDAFFIICKKLEQEPGSTLNAKKVINNRLSYKQSAIDNSQFIKQKQEKCDACGQVRRGKEETDISRLKVKQ